MTAPLYRRVMGEDWTRLAGAVRSLHDADPAVRAHGSMRIERGRPLLARLLAQILRLPRPAAWAETRLEVAAQGAAERWRRTFDGRRLETRQYESSESSGPAIAERYGLLELRFRLHAAGGGLRYVQREAAIISGPLRLPVPAWLAPRIDADENPAGPARVEVSVRVRLPGIGLLIAYHGLLDLEDGRP